MTPSTLLSGWRLAMITRIKEYTKETPLGRFHQLRVNQHLISLSTYLFVASSQPSPLANTIIRYTPFRFLFKVY
jgi:hypothetical protein